MKADPKVNQYSFPLQTAQHAPLDLDLLISHTVMHNCHNPSCTERLSNDSYHSFAKCFNKSWSGELDVRFINTGCCHFLKGEGRRAVMLASYPGSGNTWVRGLLERITGLCTGMHMMLAEVTRECINLWPI